MIRETARGLLARECPLALLHDAWENRAAAGPLWDRHLRDWTGLAQQPLCDVVLFMEEYGRACAPGVFQPTLCALLVAREADLDLDGSLALAVASAEGEWAPHDAPRKHYVPCAAEVQRLLVIEGSPQAPRLRVLDASAVVAEPVRQMDELRPLYTVETGTGGEARALAPAGWERALRCALVAASGELIGVGRHLLDSAIAYAGEREQFGRPIGSFQGLQWKLVDAAVDLERAAAAVAYAAMCVDAGDDLADRAVHSAKLEAGRAARRCARTSMQVHGGIGYTWEHGLHFWLRRAYAGDAALGPADYHAGKLAALLFAA